MRECSGLVTGGQVDAGGGRGFPEMRAEERAIGVTRSLIGYCPYLSQQMERREGVTIVCIP